ncbi:response regulator transcription factor [bacterium]|nr:response regulator transcription factor [bacterium]
MSTRVLLVDDHTLVHEGLTALLSREDGFEVVGKAETGEKGIDLAKSLRPDVIVIDVGMPGLNGIEATRMIREAVHDTRVIALSMHSDRRLVRDMLEAGAHGYLLKDCAFEELTRAIQAVLRDEVYVSSKIAGVLINNLMHKNGHGAVRRGELLSPRERQVLQLYAEGKSTKEVASILKLSRKTVESYRHQIMEKTDLHTLADLTKYAVLEGITPLEK